MSLLVTEKPPLDLTVNLQASDGSGRSRWSASESDPRNRPRGIGFKSARFSGWTGGGCTLNRSILRDWPDLGLLDEMTITGAGGRNAYEGRLISKPRTTEGGHAWTIGAVGWMAHAKDRKVPLLVIDRDLSKWRGPSRAAQASRTAAGFTAIDPKIRTDVTNGAASLALEITGAWAAGSKPDCQAWYDAGDLITIGRVRATWSRGGNVGNADTNWDWRVLLYAGDDLTGIAGNSGNLRAAGPDAVDLAATGSARFALIGLSYASGPAGVDGMVYDIPWADVRVIGTHGLAIRGGTAAEEGFYASDIIRYLVENYCPKLNADGVQESTAIVTQLAPGRVSPYDAMLMCNHSLWGLECWEGRTVHFAPTTLDDYDWQVKVSDPGVSVSYQGPAIEQLVNGIEVTYTDSGTQAQATLSPDQYSELRDTDVDNPFNRAGYPGYGEITISKPIRKGDALAAGAAALAEYNRPRSPGTITVTGHVRDRAGNWQPAYMMRGGERIQVIDDTGIRTPRLLVETDYGHDSRENTLSIDTSARSLDAALAEIGG